MEQGPYRTPAVPTKEPKLHILCKLGFHKWMLVRLGTCADNDYRCMRDNCSATTMR